VRESERDAALDAWVIVDASASMAQSDRARPEWRKIDAAAALAACVAELAFRQADRLGLAVLSSTGVTLVPPAAGARQRDRLLIALQGLEPAGEAPDETALRRLFERIAPNALVLVLSDFFGGIFAPLAAKLAATRREVLTIQILGADERDFPFRGGHRFRDPESALEIQADAGAARDDYLERFARARRELAAGLAASGVRHVEYALDQPLDLPLRRFFGGSGAELSGA
jgi:uncharacterized protein (DUF58 family)